jgi:hypothetical protein
VDSRHPKQSQPFGVLEQAIFEAQRPLLEQLKQIHEQLELLALAKVASSASTKVQALGASFTAKELATHWKVNRKYVLARIRAKELPAKWIGRQYVVSAADAEAFKPVKRNSKNKSMDSVDLDRKADELLSKFRKG